MNLNLFGKLNKVSPQVENANRISLQYGAPPDPASIQNMKRRTIVLTPYKRTNSKATKQNSWDKICTLIALSIAVGLLALILESCAYAADTKWNKILKSEATFPNIGDEFFTGKMLTLEAHSQAPERFQSQIKNTRSQLMRASSLELSAIVIIVIFMTLEILLLIAYTQGEEHRKTVSLIHMFGAAVTFTCAMLIISSDMAIDGYHEEAVASLEEYLTYIKTQFSLKNGTVGFNNIVNVGEHETMIDQLEIMIKIQRLCNLGKSKRGRYGYAIESRRIHIYTKEYSLDHMRDLKFCSLEGVKFAAMFFCLIYSLMCLGTAGFIYWRDCKKPVAPDQCLVDPKEPTASEDPGKQYVDFISPEKPKETAVTISEKKPSTYEAKEKKSDEAIPESRVSAENVQRRSSQEAKPEDLKEPRWDERDFAVAPTPPLPTLSVTGSHLL